MANSKLTLSKLLLVFLVLAAAIFGLEKFTEGGSLMFSMLFFVAIAQGPLTIVAAADIVNSHWLKPYRREMLSVYPMNLFLALLFAVFFLTGKLHLYDWTEHQNAWLNQGFFVIRNIVLLLIVWVVGGKFAKESLSESSVRARWGVIWVFTFVISQTIVAFDWVMSLDYPWISTLFGAYFFVEAFYAGCALAAVFTYFNYQNFLNDFPESTFKKSQMDMMTLMFGFSIFWAYQFFSQFLVIWYGNIPEEVSWLTKRIEIFSDSLYLVLLILFVIPFWTLLSRKVKASPRAVMLIGLSIWAGIMLERIFMIGPHLNLNPVIVLVEFILIGGIFLWIVRNRAEALP